MEEVNDQCTAAEFADLSIYLHCMPSEVEIALNKNFLHKLVLQDHPDYDTI